MNTFIKGVTMPKIIGNVRENIIQEAKRVMLESTEPLNVRSISQACHIAVGTFYNYFESKEYLMAVVLLEDWNALMQKLALDTKNLTPREGLKSIFFGIRDFTAKYQKAWRSGELTADAMREKSDRHTLLISQIKACIDCFIPHPFDPFLNEFLAENILRFASERSTDYEDLDRMITKLLN